jgi:hypothetical protein
MKRALQPMNEYKQTWLFQANPKVWIGFSEQFKQQTVGATGDWTVSRYWKKIDPGDRVLLWEVGSNARLLAIGELTGSRLSWIHQYGDLASKQSLYGRCHSSIPIS